MTIRPARTEDWPRIREICCLTGKAGAPIATERWKAFGEFWIGPYEKFYPGFAYVAERDGVVQGYLTGCPDTAEFAQRKLLVLENNPNDAFTVPPEYAAHLHVNLVPEERGKGTGEKLIQAFEADLQKLNIKGIHLFCGPGPLKFYEKCGFRILAKNEFKKDVWVYCLVKDHKLTNS